MCGAGDGVAQVAAVDLGDYDLVLVGETEEEAGEELVGIGAAQMYVAARVSAVEAFDVDAEVEEVLGSKRTLVGEECLGVDAAGTAYEYLGVVLRVEVEQH